MIISIHALRAEGDALPRGHLRPFAGISIHALRAEGDARIVRHAGRVRVISIHALRAEGDSTDFMVPASSC